jgi:phage FluMu gp28-like protein
MTREVFEMENQPTYTQRDLLRHRIKRARRVCFDYTGPGIGLGDLLVEEHGEWNPEKHLFGKIELVTFSNTLKCEIFPAVRADAERRMLGIPINRVIREDLHSMARVVTSAGNVTYRAPHTPDGHADRFTALALANRARKQTGSIIIAAFSNPGRAAAAYASRRDRTILG